MYVLTAAIAPATRVIDVLRQMCQSAYLALVRQIYSKHIRMDKSRDSKNTSPKAPNK